MTQTSVLILFDSIEKKEQDLEMIDNDENPFDLWNKKKSGFALL